LGIRPSSTGSHTALLHRHQPTSHCSWSQSRWVTLLLVWRGWWKTYTLSVQHDWIGLGNVAGDGVEASALYNSMLWCAVLCCAVQDFMTVLGSHFRDVAASWQHFLVTHVAPMAECDPGMVSVTAFNSIASQGRLLMSSTHACTDMRSVYVTMSSTNGLNSQRRCTATTSALGAAPP
jgi:hypothetical protein